MQEPVPSDDQLLALLDIEERDMSVVITNARRSDNVMVYVSEEFEAQTGYSADEALGRNCRFLQGPDTDPATVMEIKRAVAAGETLCIDILNYKKCGAPFMNRLRLRPLLDDEGSWMYYVGVQNPIEQASPKP